MIPNKYQIFTDEKKVGTKTNKIDRLFEQSA